MPGALAVDRAVVERGNLPRGPLLQQAFRLANRGPLPLEILEVRTSCGCIQHQLDSHQLAPGATAKLDLIINTLSQPSGPNRWPVFVRYREGDRSGELALVVAAQLFSRIDAQPASLMLRTRGQLGSELVLQAAQPFSLLSCSTTTPALTVTATSDSVPSATHRLQVQVAAGLAAGEYTGFVQVRTDDPVVPELAVPVRVVKLADAAEQPVRAYPASVHLRPDNPCATLQLRSATGQPVAIESAELSVPQALTVRHAAGPGPNATVRLSLIAGPATNSPGQARLTLHLAQPVGASVSVPISWGD